jgi:hypothetical protein
MKYSMTERTTAFVGLLMLAGGTALTVNACAQEAGSGYTVPRTAFGHPDLQGYWSIASYTPLERPDGVTKAFYTPEELNTMLRERAGLEALNVEAGRAGDVHYENTQFGLDRSLAPLARNPRTSLVVDPPDGRIPPLTPAGEARVAANKERLARASEAAEYNNVDTRCLIMRGAGPPMFDAGYNNNIQIVQTPDHVMILVEMIHDARIIPLDDRPWPHSDVRKWTGVSRGHWEGETLVVETANFNGKNQIRELGHTGRGSSADLRVVERFTRTAEDEILYRYTVDDPSTWVAPWTAEMPLAASEGPMFEFACHEGNYGLLNTLKGARFQEQQAAGAAGRSGAQ